MSASKNTYDITVRVMADGDTPDEALNNAIDWLDLSRDIVNYQATALEGTRQTVQVSSSGDPNAHRPL